MPIPEELVIWHIFGIEEFQDVNLDLQGRVLFWRHQKTGSDFCRAGWVHLEHAAPLLEFADPTQDEAVPAHSEVVSMAPLPGCCLPAEFSILLLLINE